MYVVISWIFTTFTGSTTTSSFSFSPNKPLWLAEFLLPLQGQQQRLPLAVRCRVVVISLIFNNFKGSTKTKPGARCKNGKLWLAEFLLPLQGQQQQAHGCCWRCFVVISWIFTNFTGSTTTDLQYNVRSERLWLAEFLLPLQGQQQQTKVQKSTMVCCD